MNSNLTEGRKLVSSTLICVPKFRETFILNVIIIIIITNNAFKCKANIEITVCGNQRIHFITLYNIQINIIESAYPLHVSAVNGHLQVLCNTNIKSLSYV
jgi:hypothetical protein